MPRIWIDEKAFRKGHSYITLIYDLDNSTVEAIADGKSTGSGNASFPQLPAEQLKSVEAIAMNMSDAYIRSARENIDEADKKIVHDRFHVMPLLSKAVDNVRLAEHKELTALNDDILKGSRYYWLTGFERLTERQKQKFDKLLDQNLETGVAWSFKQMLRDLWFIPNKRAATAFFRSWYDKIVNNGLKPLISAANAIHERLAHVMNYCTHGITNAIAEELNNKIMAIKRRLAGYRNRENFKAAIYFYCGDLDLYPH